MRRQSSSLGRGDASLKLRLDHLIALRMLAGSELFFVQVGAFDGRSGDPLHEWIVRYEWRGILVEPQPRAFAALQRTYADRPDLTLRNVAVAERRGTRTLYTIREDLDDAPWWTHQVASFDREHVTSRGLAAGGEKIVEPVPVECVTFAELLDGVERVDLLQIDVEGYDATLLGLFDFDRYRPAIVSFENVHLSPRELNSAIRRLVEYDYRVGVCGKDTVGWQPLASPPRAAPGAPPAGDPHSAARSAR